MGFFSCLTTTASTSNASATSNSDADKLVALLGESLVSASSGNVKTAEALAGKTVGLYFSAHWCPPCRSFTPKLAAAYTTALKAKGVEIVFVSSDRDASAFSEYFSEQPWLALPFGNRAIKAALSDKFRVSGIPTLVLLNGDASLLATDGRAKVMSDPSGKSWVPAPPVAKPAEETVPRAATQAAMGGGLGALLGSEPFLDTDGKTPISLTDIAKGSPLIAIYFSAHWCGPCRGFTPQLITFVQMLEEEGKRLPVIFASSDRDDGSFQDYFSSMPWFAFPLKDPRIEALKAKYEASGIPWLVVLDADGNLVMNEADTDVPTGPDAAYPKWLAIAKKKQPDVAAAPAA